jgi:RsiW-degrading membrane proteinase PrsW (M82 family)
MIESLLAVSAIAPSALLVWYFHARDLYPEPPLVLWTTFALGVLSVLPVLMVGVPIHHLIAGIEAPVIRGFFEAFFVAAVPEEFFKLAVLLLYSMRRVEFDEPMDGIVYGVVASLGFATFENVLYVFDGGLGVAVSRAFSAVPFHAFAGAILGYYVGQAKFRPEEKWLLIVKGYGAVMVLHGLYDFPLLTLMALEKASSGGLLALVTVAALVVEWRWTLRLVRRLRTEQLALRSAAANAEGTMSATAVPVTAGTRIGAVFQTVVGLLFASGGGTVILGLMLAAAMGAVAEEHAMNVLVGGVVIGLFPFLGGLVLFIRGVQNLNGR